jgi:hypothetical protein
MGRFARIYPTEVLGELVALVLDGQPPRNVPQAVAEIKAKHGVEVKVATARAYVRDQRRKRRLAESPPVGDPSLDVSDALDQLARGVIVALDLERDRMHRAARAGKPLDLDRAVKVSRSIKELRAGISPRRVTSGNDDDQGEEPEPTGNGEVSPEAARLLAADAADRET